MTPYLAGTYRVAVVGAGHAGIEAGLASARLGCKTAVFTVNLDWVGNMPCNPSIGGTSKGHLVREIDALGGEMGIAADKNTLQNRMLNLGKGPAVHSLRAQADKQEYQKEMNEKYKNEEVNDIDGVKIDFADKWVHLRKSNTEPIIRVYSEANSMEAADEIGKKIMDVVYFFLWI